MKIAASSRQPFGKSRKSSYITQERKTIQLCLSVKTKKSTKTENIQRKTAETSRNGEKMNILSYIHVLRNNCPPTPLSDTSTHSIGPSVDLRAKLWKKMRKKTKKHEKIANWKTSTFKNAIKRLQLN